jgi:hypothetical protein
MKYFCHSNSCIRCSRSIAGRAGQVGSPSGCLLQILGYVSTSTPSPWHPPQSGVRAGMLYSTIWKLWWFSSQMVTSELKGRYDPRSFLAANSHPCHSSWVWRSSGCIYFLPRFGFCFFSPSIFFSF